jgi:hypothetical protein
MLPLVNEGDWPKHYGAKHDKAPRCPHAYARVVNLTSTVTRLQGDQHDDHQDIGMLKVEHTRWELYMKVATDATDTALRGDAGAVDRVQEVRAVSLETFAGEEK